MDSVQAFNDLYKAIEGADEPDDWQKLEICLNQIFCSLQESANDVLERVFLSELQANVKKILINQVEHYAYLSRKVTNLKHNSKKYNDCVIEGVLRPTCLSKIKNLTDSIVVELRSSADLGFISRESLSMNSGFAVRKLMRILNGEFRDLGVLQDSEATFRFKTRIVGAAIEVSVGEASWWKHSHQAETAPKTLYAHVDEGIDAPKAIVYLTDVTQSQGPFSYYPNLLEELKITGIQSLIGRSVACIGQSEQSPLFHDYSVSLRRTSSPLFRAHFMRLPESLRFNSHFGWDVIPDSSLETRMVNNEISIIGPAGTFVIFDGARVVHRGGMVQNGHRVAIQVILGRAGLYASIRRLALRLKVRVLN